MDRQHFIDMAQREVGKPNRFGGQFAKSKLIRASDGTNHSEAIFSSDDGQAIAVVKIDRDNGLYIKVYRESTSIISMVDTDAKQPKQDDANVIKQKDELFEEAEKFLMREFHPKNNSYIGVFDKTFIKALQRRFRIGYNRANQLFRDISNYWYSEKEQPQIQQDELFYEAKELLFKETAYAISLNTVHMNRAVDVLQKNLNIDHDRASELLNEVISVV